MLQNWRELLQAKNAVVMYDPDTDEGWWWVTRKPEDDDLIRRPPQGDQVS
jgi:hypothetical protein